MGILILITFTLSNIYKTIIMKKIGLSFIFNLILGLLSFAQERSNVPTNVENADRNQKVKQEVLRVLDTYRDILGQLGNLNTPQEERQELKESLVENYFKPSKDKFTFIYNTIDPRRTTGREFENADQFLDNLMLWYKEGYTYSLDIDKAEFSTIKRQDEFYYVQVNLFQSLSGRYLEDTQKSNLNHKLTFYIRFELGKAVNGGITSTTVKNPFIIKIASVDFKPIFQFVESMYDKNTVTSLGKRIAFPVRWDATTMNPLTIALYKDGKFVAKLSESAENDLYYWTPAEELKADNNYHLRLSTQNDSIYVDSKPFALVEKKYIKVLYPHQGDSLSKGDETQIRWESNLKSNFKIELFKEGVLATTLVKTTNKNMFTWAVPKDTSLTASNTYQIKVTALDDTLSVYSEGMFVISNLPTSPFIKIIKPFAATRILRRDKYLIDWVHNLTPAKFQIQLYREGIAIPVQSINDNVYKASYLWKVSRKLPERKDYYVEVSSIDKPDLKMKSNLFAIQKRSPWKWVGIGAGAILTGVLIRILTQTDDSLPPIEGTPDGR
jgi:hypothetical protein